MATALYNYVLRFLSLSWLTGPIFEKELRVSSRRRRNYILRFAHLALLICFLSLIWVNVVPQGSWSVYQASRMGRAGQSIIAFIIWFQFVTTQLVAAVMLSTSISDEIYHRTLGLLMTTPINSFQVVLGKLFSKLLQLILLLAISLPLLAIVRVFGGVPWDFIVLGLCITLTTVLFVGSVSLFFSIMCRRAYVVIILTVLTLGLIFGLIPIFAAMLFISSGVSEAWFFSAFSHVNPYILLAIETERMTSPGMMGVMGGVSWSLHCIIMLCASACLLFISMLLVRRVALRQATGQLGVSSAKRRSREIVAGKPAHLRPSAAPRRVRGSPILWKELRAPLLGRRKLAFAISIAIGLILLFITYAFCADNNMLDEEDVHVIYCVIFAGLGILFTIILPATCITSEKESRSWPLLLSTTLSDWQIIWGKFVGILRRCLPVWSVLFGHILLFTLAGIIHPIALVQMGVLVAWIVVFLSGTGLYFGTRFKRTTSAVIANFALAGVLWGLMPFVLLLLGEIDRGFYEFSELLLDTNPFVHTAVIMDAAHGGGTLRYLWLDVGARRLGEATIWMLMCTFGYMLLGFLFALRAKCRLRRNIF